MGARDAEHLRLLATLHYVVAGLTAAFSLLGVLYILIGAWLIYGSAELSGEVTELLKLPAEEDPVLLGVVCVIAGAVLAVLCLLHAAVVAWVGRCISRRRRWLLSMIFSVFHLVYFPLGTGLSVFALTVLRRPGVKELFGRPTGKVAPPQ